MRNKSKATILFVGNHFRSDKSNTNVWHDLAVRLRNRGWQVLVTSSQTKRFPRLVDMAVTIITARHRYDLAQIDVFSGPSFIWAEMAAGLLRLLGKPFILTLHGGNLPEFSQQHPARVARLLQTAQAVTAPSAYLHSRLSHLREDVRVIPNPIDIQAYPFRQRTQIKPALVWVRAFHEIYNPSLAPKLLHELIKTRPDAHLTMVGPDKGDGSLQRMQNLAASLDVQDHIKIIGAVPREQVPTWLDQGDIFINTTNIDNTPLSVLEAMACGLCVVSTDVGGIPYLIDHETNGLLVPLNDSQSIAVAVDRILTEPELAESLSREAHVKAKAYDWCEILPQWDNLFAGLMEKGNG